ncbi:MAG: hypothetical protein ACYC40_01015 [Patescibacteria group bacterium]
MTEKNPERKNMIKKNLKFLVLLIILSLIAWFGVKMIVSKSTTTVTSSTKKNSSLIQTGFGRGGTPPADAGGSRPGL